MLNCLWASFYCSEDKNNWHSIHFSLLNPRSSCMGCRTRRNMWRRLAEWKPWRVPTGLSRGRSRSIGGVVRVGLTDAELMHLAQAGDVMKLWRSTRRCDCALAHKRDRRDDGQRDDAAWPTALVSACFATGGVGGVPFAAIARDISADLLEFTTTPVVVVCAGNGEGDPRPAGDARIPRRTHSVPVLGYQTDDFPAFYSRSSGLKVQGMRRFGNGRREDYPGALGAG